MKFLFTKRGFVWETKLAEKIRRNRPDHDIDVVMPIPDSGRTSAMSLAESLGVYHIGKVLLRIVT